MSKTSILIWLSTLPVNGPSFLVTTSSNQQISVAKIPNPSSIFPTFLCRRHQRTRMTSHWSTTQSLVFVQSNFPNSTKKDRMIYVLRFTDPVTAHDQIIYVTSNVLRTTGTPSLHHLTTYLKDSLVFRRLTLTSLTSHSSSSTVFSNFDPDLLISWSVTFSVASHQANVSTRSLTNWDFLSSPDIRAFLVGASPWIDDMTLLGVEPLAF